MARGLDFRIYTKRGGSDNKGADQLRGDVTLKFHSRLSNTFKKLSFWRNVFSAKVVMVTTSIDLAHLTK